MTPSTSTARAPLPAPARRRMVLVAAALVASTLGGFASAWRVLLESPGSAGPAPATGVPAGVLRGLWVREETILSPQGVDAAVQMARRTGTNALFVQVLSRGEAAYRSSIWPQARSAGVSPSFDPLAEVIRQARRGTPAIQVHAWVNVYTWGKLGETPASSPEHPLARHPDWVTVDSKGRTLWQYRPGESPYVTALFVDPGVEGVRRTMTETVLELVRRYDLDGVHLDYVRYPWEGTGYHPESLRSFWRSYRAGEPLEGGEGGPAASSLPPAYATGEGAGPLAMPRTPEEQAAWNLFRARQVTTLVREIRDALARESYRIALTAAVLPDPRQAYETGLQEWPAWLAERLLTGVALMSYSPSTATVRDWVSAAVKLAYGTPVYAGIAAYLAGSRPSLVQEQAEAARSAGASGVIYFSFESLEGFPELEREAAAALAP